MLQVNGHLKEKKKLRNKQNPTKQELKNNWKNDLVI